MNDSPAPGGCTTQIELKFECTIYFELDGKIQPRYTETHSASKWETIKTIIAEAEEQGIHLHINGEWQVVKPCRIEVRKVTVIREPLDPNNPIYKEHASWLDALNATMAYSGK